MLRCLWWKCSGIPAKFAAPRLGAGLSLWNHWAMKRCRNSLLKKFSSKNRRQRQKLVVPLISGHGTCFLSVILIFGGCVKIFFEKSRNISKNCVFFVFWAIFFWDFVGSLWISWYNLGFSAVASTVKDGFAETVGLWHIVMYGQGWLVEVFISCKWR